MLNLISKLFGSKKDKDVREMQPLVRQINEFYASYRNFSDDELRGKTSEFRNRIQDYLKDITAEMEEIQGEIAQLENSEETDEKERLFEQADKLKKSRNKSLEEILLEILPEAFAVVKETARRWTEQKQLKVKATQLDRDLAVSNSNITIEGEYAIWSNTWIAAGAEIEWSMIHYDVQLIGGIVLHQGKISEMATGEGKTLVSTLPAYLNVLSAPQIVQQDLGQA